MVDFRPQISLQQAFTNEEINGCVFRLDGLQKFIGVGILVRSEDEPFCSGYQLSGYWFQKMKGVKWFHNY
jgi:hypothetical protein